MARRTLSTLAGLGLALLLGGALAACATPTASSPSAEPTATSTPSDSGSGSGGEGEIDAAWLDGGRLIGLVTYGSSGCVPLAEDAKLNGSVLEVTLAEPEDATACTADYAPRVTLVGVPEGVDPSEDLEIVVSGADVDGDTELEGVDGLTGGGETDYLPSAGWTDIDDTFVLLTWGSSSCAPVIQDAAASGPAEVTVTFVTPPADQVCTMDMAPRALVVTVADLEDDDDVTAILTGTPEFDNVRVSILGSD